MHPCTHARIHTYAYRRELFTAPHPPPPPPHQTPTSGPARPSQTPRCVQRQNCWLFVEHARLSSDPQQVYERKTTSLIDSCGFSAETPISGPSVPHCQAIPESEQEKKKRLKKRVEYSLELHTIDRLHAVCSTFLAVESGSFTSCRALYKALITSRAVIHQWLHAAVA